MSNVIRPVFGAKSKQVASAAKPIERFTVIRGFGSACGHVIGLVRVDERTGSASLRVVVGPDDCDAAMTIITLPDTAEGEATAETVCLAVLRALRVAGGTLPTGLGGRDQGHGQ